MLLTLHTHPYFNFRRKINNWLMNWLNKNFDVRLLLCVFELWINHQFTRFNRICICTMYTVQIDVFLFFWRHKHNTFVADERRWKIMRTTHPKWTESKELVESIDNKKISFNVIVVLHNSFNNEEIKIIMWRNNMLIMIKWQWHWLCVHVNGCGKQCG